MLLDFAAIEVLRKAHWRLERQLTFIFYYWLISCSCKDQQATGVNNTNVQGKLSVYHKAV